MAEQQVALVTGGSTGIGAAIVASLVGAGHHVLSLARRPAAMANAKVTSVAVDLTNAAETEAVAKDLAARYAITHIVHNAGAIRPALIEAAQLEDLAALSQLHLGAAIALVQAALPAMKARATGRIILIGSRAGLGAQTRTAYSATKAGMIGMARTWALELGPHGITVNVVAPGPIEATEMFHGVLPKGDERIGRLAQSIPLKRLGTPEDVAHAVAYFASPAAGFVTGQVLYVCGGASVSSITI